jgi:hypothetical protein
MILTNTTSKYSILDLGYSKLIVRTTSDGKITESDLTPELKNLITSGVAAKTITSGELTQDINLVSGYLQSENFVTGVSGWQLTPTSAELNVSTALSSLDIPDTTSANSFHTDSLGNSWWGATTFAAAIAKISSAGAITGSSVTITGGSVATSTLSGTVAQSNLNIANMGWTQTCAFSVTDLDTVSWGAGTLTTAGGTTYNIGAGNTGNMAARTYIYLDIAVSTTAYQVTTTSATAVGGGKILVATALNGATEATFQVFGGSGGQNIDASSIVANSITSNEISAGYVYAGSIAVSQLTAGTITSKAITMTVSEGTGDSKIQWGKTDFGDTTSGIIVGIDDSDSNLPKIEMGDATSYMGYSGTALYSNNLKLYETFTCGENITIGDVVCIKGTLYGSYSTTETTEDTYASEANPTDPHPDVDTIFVGWLSSLKVYLSYMKFNLTNVPTNFLKAELVFYESSSTGTVSKLNGLNIGRITEDWNEDDLTWNAKPVSTVDTQPNTTDGIANTAITAGAKLVYVDITTLVRQWKDGIYDNYGLCLRAAGSADATNTYIEISTKEHATTGQRPYLRITRYESSDGYVYKADADDYNLCRSIVGIATETKSSTESCKVQTFGKNASISLGIGNIAYLSTSPGLVLGDTVNLPRIIEVGKCLAADTALIGIQKSGIFIEKIPASIQLSSTAPETTSCEIIVPPDATYALIDYEETIDASPDISYRHKIRIDQCGLSANTTDASRITWGNAAQWESFGDNIGGVTKAATFEWSGNSITITKNATHLNMRFNIYFYK